MLRPHSPQEDYAKAKKQNAKKARQQRTAVAIALEEQQVLRSEPEEAPTVLIPLEEPLPSGPRKGALLGLRLLDYRITSRAENGSNVPNNKTSVTESMNFLTRTYFLLIVVFCALSQSSYAATSAVSKRPLSKDHILQLVLRGIEIENCEVAASELINAINALQDLAEDGKHASQPIVLRHCLIKGDLILSRRGNRILLPIAIRDSDFEDSVNFNSNWFKGRVSFTGVHFKKVANFNGVHFENGAFFNNSIFHENVFFNNAVFMEHTDFDRVEFYDEVNLKEVDSRGELHFKATVFKAKVDLSRAAINEISFQSTDFFRDALFIGISSNQNAVTKKNILEFSDVNFRGRVYFNNTKIDNLLFTKNWAYWGIFEVEEFKGFQLRQYEPGKDLIEQLWEQFEQSDMWQRHPKRLSVPPVKFMDRAFFSDIECDKADFTRVEFTSYVDFNKARFQRLINLNDSLFEKEADFFLAKFPNPAGLTLDNARFNTVPAIKWDQIKDSIKTNRIETLNRLEDVFRRIGNLDEQNEVMYYRRIKEGEKEKGWAALIDRVEYWFWGYRVRPLQVLFWMVIFYFVFAAVYWFQTKSLARGRSRWQGILQRIKFCLKFSFLTSYKVGYGREHSRTPLFKMLTSFHSLLFKGMFACLLIVFSNISPFLKELVGKLLPL